MDQSINLEITIGDSKTSAQEDQLAREEYLMNCSSLDDENHFNSLISHSDVHQNQKETETIKLHISSIAKQILEKWMYEHRFYCYPTKTEKQSLARKTGLTVQKVSNWFINSRRRMLPKMLENEGKSSADYTISRKKNKNFVKDQNGSTVTSTSVDQNQTNDFSLIEEAKIIDDNCVLLENDFEVDEVHINRSSIEPANEFTYQEVYVPVTKKSTDESVPCESTIIENPSVKFTRGILYDEATKQKCLFIVTE